MNAQGSLQHFDRNAEAPETKRQMRPFILESDSDRAIEMRNATSPALSLASDIRGWSM